MILAGDIGGTKTLPHTGVIGIPGPEVPGTIRLPNLTQSTPVYVITNNNAALQGAAQTAFERNKK